MLIHVVKQGETLWIIANNYHVTVESIAQLNGLLNPDDIVVGLALLIPTQNDYYTVKSGDTLWMIAQKYNTGINEIIKANNIKNPANILPGQVLYIPPIRHSVRPGETLWTIAQRYGVSIQDIIGANTLKDPNIIYPGTVLIIPRVNKPKIDVNGYIYFYGETAGPIVKEHGSQLTYLCPFAYLIKEDGSLKSIYDTYAIMAAYTSKTVPLMCITNFTSTSKGENLAHVVLSSPQLTENILTNSITVMKEKGYKGLNIDFENVLPADRELYNNFITRAVARLHPLSYSVSTALAPKVSAEQSGALYEAHDYPAHGRIVDFVVLMTYEWGWKRAAPQAISPLDQINRVLDYAVSVIPPKKILMGFQIYARDWVIPHVPGQEAETFSPQEAVQRAIKYGSEIMYDYIAQSPYYRYKNEQGIMHEVWFEDARSARAKFESIKSYDLKGVSYWALGYPFVQNWALLENDFSINKLM